MKSVVLILPIELKDAGNAVAIALGYDTAPGNTYSTPLSYNGQEPVTHYGCHTWATQDFVYVITAAKNRAGLPNIDWSSAGIDEEIVYNVCSSLIMSVRDIDTIPYTHFNDTVTAHNLQRIEYSI